MLGRLERGGRFDTAVAETERHVCPGGGHRVVRDEDDRSALSVSVVEKIKHGSATFRVEISGRFVGEDDLRVVGEHAGDGHPLLLPDAQLTRLVLKPIPQADLPKQLNRPRTLLGGRSAGQ